MKKVEKIALLHGSVPGAGVEPARVAPSVFETDASTDSAIRASFAPFQGVLISFSTLQLQR